MLDRLPAHINPVSFSEKGKTLVGALNISELARISDMLTDNSGQVEIDFTFDKDGRVPVVDGFIKARLQLVCQSCLEGLEWLVEKHIKLGVVTSLEQADRLGNNYEPLFLEEEKISLLELVEDELLLALPDFPRHEEACTKRHDSASETYEEQETESNNPFSVLAKLKNIGD